MNILKLFFIAIIVFSFMMNGTDSTLYFVGNSPEAAFRTLGIGVAQITNMTNITDEKYIREMLLYFTDRFPKVNLWVSVSAEVPCSD